MKVLLVGDVVGSPGRRVFREVVKRLRAESAVHAVVVNAENAAAGSGITMALAQEIFAAGADVITMGDHAWGQRDLENTIGGEKRLIRPVNSPPGTPGQGSVTVQTALGPLTVVSLLGRVFMNRRTARSARWMRCSTHCHATCRSSWIFMPRRPRKKLRWATIWMAEWPPWSAHTHVQTSERCCCPRARPT